ncbi:MAG: hypothetical protein ACD_28C00061G0005 [uncultured bacterium]|nr:MAG: hypothetical protein ACD_28C00061G0005 [uncultured bacterium]KKT74569.1 MAG: hypothetical protein UW70_C0050G0005 [Candidatus Peregrinibacteria bacterium GW2011_GWA2_44_7]
MQLTQCKIKFNTFSRMILKFSERGGERMDAPKNRPQERKADLEKRQELMAQVLGVDKKGKKVLFNPFSKEFWKNAKGAPRFEPKVVKPWELEGPATGSTEAIPPTRIVKPWDLKEKDKDEINPQKDSGTAEGVSVKNE